MIASEQGWFDIREDILEHHDWFKCNDLIPADGTIARIIATIEPAQFNECFAIWRSSIHTLSEGQIVAIVGKTLRGSYNREDRKGTIHVVSAYVSSNKLVLGQLKELSKKVIKQRHP